MQPCIPAAGPRTPLSYPPLPSLQGTAWESEIESTSSARGPAKGSSRSVSFVLLSLLNGDLKSMIIKGKEAKLADSWHWKEGGEQVRISPSRFPFR